MEQGLIECRFLGVHWIGEVCFFVGGVELCAHDREVISRELVRGRSCRTIGCSPGRNHSVISREVERNGGARVLSCD
ncbi:helix-turn-helix domain-containing protein [Amycolatopsis cihanbeyliensis]|uniref:helix-turn-helix domain-containing protein n=1 Tax=Amycolatopsis cihanbeyliensis TaxID=1128664 RepID=UPI00319E535D